MKPEMMEHPLLSKTKEGKSLSGKDFVTLFQAVLDKETPFRFAAKGFSMSPFIKDGDIITVYPLGTKQPRVGDVVAFWGTSTEKLMTHRLIEKRGDFLLFKGDLNSEPDGWITREELLGIVKRVERNGQKKYLGLGKERILIAWLTRKNVFFPLLEKSRMLKKCFKKNRSILSYQETALFISV